MIICIVLGGVLGGFIGRRREKQKASLGTGHRIKRGKVVVGCLCGILSGAFVGVVLSLCVLFFGPKVWSTVGEIDLEPFRDPIARDSGKEYFLFANEYGSYYYVLKGKWHYIYGKDIRECSGYFPKKATLVRYHGNLLPSYQVFCIFSWTVRKNKVFIPQDSILEFCPE